MMIADTLFRAFLFIMGALALLSIVAILLQCRAMKRSGERNIRRGF